MSGKVTFVLSKLLLLLLILDLLFTALPQTLFIKSLSATKAQLAGIIAGLEPAYEFAFAAVVLNEIPIWSTIFGRLVVIGAVIVAMRAHSDAGGGVGIEVSLGLSKRGASNEKYTNSDSSCSDDHSTFCQLPGSGIRQFGGIE